MSTTVDERVVEMRFDNKQFESNVATSMSTLDKLKQKLNLPSTSKGLENIGAAAKKIDMSGLGSAIESVQAKFSALDVVGVTALANITNTAVNAGKSLIKSLTIDQVTSGWSKYEQKTASVQTIMNATGKSIDEVNAYLDKLMWYSDETSYGFNDMTAAIAQMTSSGGDIEKLIPMVEGVANSVAFAGKGAAEFSRVMFNLNQSYGAGYLQLMDWRSVELAGAGSKQLKQVFIDTATALGKLNEEGKTANGTLVTASNFSSTLSEKWATTDVMEQAFGRFAKVTEAAYAMVQDDTNEIDNATTAYKVLSGELDKTSDEYLSLSESQKALVGTFSATEIAAAKSAQEAKSFSEAIEATKDAVSSGWMKTSELIFGNYEQSKKLWSDVTEQLWEIFASGGETRNDILTNVMTSGWEKIGKVVRKAGIETSAFEKKVSECAKEGGVDVDSLIKKYGSLGDAFRNGAIDTKYLKTAFDSLNKGAGGTSKVIDKLSVDLDSIFSDKNGKTQLGFGDSDHESVKKVQTALDELGFTLDKFGVDGLFGSETQSRLKEFQKSVGLEETGIVDQKTIDALKKAGQEIEDLGGSAKGSKLSIDDLLDSVNKPSGRELVFDIIHNSLESIVGVLKTFRSAWADIFSEDRLSSGLYNALKGIKKITEGIKNFVTDEKNVTQLTDSFKGLAAVFDIIVSLAGGGVKLVFKSLSAILKAFGFNILGVTSNIGSLLVSFRNWILDGDKIGKVVNFLSDQFSMGIGIIKNWGSNLLKSLIGQNNIEKISKALERLSNAFKLLKEGKLIFPDIIKEIGTFCLSILNLIPIFKTWSDAFNTWLESLKVSDDFQKITDAVEKLKTAFTLLKEGKLNLADFAIEIGKFIVSVLECIPVIKNWVAAIKGWFKSFENLPAVQQFIASINAIKDAFSKLLNGDIDFAKFGALLGENLGKIIASLPKIIEESSSGIIAAAKRVGNDFIEGFKNGIGAGVASAISSIVAFCTNFIAAFSAALGVHSPSVIAYAIGAFFIAGFVTGLIDNEGSIIGTIKQLGEGIAAAFKSLVSYLTDEAGNIQWDKIIAGGMTVSTLVVLNKFANAFNKIAGAVTSFSDILKSVKGVIDEFKNTIKVFQTTLKAVNLDIIAGAAMKIAISVGILVAAVWAIAQIDDIGKLWNAVGVITVLCIIMGALAFALSKFSDANVSISKDGVDLKGLQTILIQIGIVVVLLAATAKLLGTMTSDQLKQGFIGLAGIAVGLIVFIAAMGKIAKAAGDADVSKFGTTMLKISAALIIMTIAMRMLSKMDTADILIGVAVLEMFVLFCMQLGIANKLAGQNGQNFGSNVLKIAIAMAALATVMKIVAKMRTKDIIKGIAVLQAFVVLIGEMAIVNRLAGGVSSKIGGTVMSMASSMMILAGTLWLLSSMDESAIDNGIRVMQKFVFLIAELTVVSQLGRGATNIAANILAMSTAIGILAGIAVVLSLIPLKGLAKGIAAIGMLGAAMSLMIWATRGANDVKGNIIAMAVAIGIMAAVVVVLSSIDGSKLAGSVAALGTLMIVFGLLTKLAGKAESSWKMVGAFTTMIGVILALTGVIIILSKLDPKAALPNAIALSILLTAFAGALVIMGHAGKISTTVSKQLAPLTAVIFGLALILAMMNGLDPGKAIANAVALGILLNAMAAALAIMAAAGKISTTVSKQLAPLTAVVFALGIILAMMNGLDPGKAIANAIALGILLNAMAAALVIMGVAGRISTTVSGQLGPLTAVVAGLAIILGIMAALDVEASIPTAIALGILLNALAASMFILGLAGPTASKAVPAAAVMGVVLAEIAFILGILAKCEIQPSIETAVALSTLLLAVSAACLIVSLIPAAAAIDGALGLAAFIGIIAGVVSALGALSKISGFTELLAGGGQVLGLIGQAIGNFVGGIVNGVASGLVGIIPEIGAALADFAKSVEPFISLISGIDSSAIAGAGILAGAIVALTAADFIAGITSLFSLGQSSFAAIGMQLTKFAEGAKQFVDVVKDIDPSAVDSVGTLSEMILALTATDILSGLKEFFGGGSLDFEALGTQLQQFGDAVVGFSQTISGKIDTAAVQAAVDAGDLLVALTKSLPKSGGKVQEWFGQEDLSGFASAVSDFAECMIEINDILSQEGLEIQSDKIEKLADAGTSFSELVNSLPKSGGVVQKYLGQEDLSGFASAISDFAACMIEVNETLSNPQLIIQSQKITQLAKAGTQFSELVNSLPKSGGVVQEFLGEEQLNTFGDAVSHFAACMVEVNEALNVEGFSVNLDGMEQLKQAGDKMIEMQDSLPKTGGWWQKIAGEDDIGDFGNKIKAFATAISDFSEQSKGLKSDGIDLAIRTAYRIKDLAGVLKDIDYSGVTEFTGVGTGGFGADGPAYKIGKAIAAFGEQVADIDTSRVTTSVTAACQLRDLISSLVGLDASGVENFKPKDIGSAIKVYSDEVSGIDTSIVTSSITSAVRLKNMIDSLSDFDNSGISKFKPGPVGESMRAYADNIGELDVSKVSASIDIANRLKTFVTSLTDFDNSGIWKFNVTQIGTSISSYATSVAELDYSSVYASVLAANNLRDFVVSLVEFDNSGISKFDISQIASSLSSYSMTVSSLNMDAVSNSIAAANRLRNFISSLKSFDGSGISTFKSAISELSKMSIAGLTDGFSNAASKLSAAGTQMISGLVKGLQDGISSVRAASGSIVSAARSAIVSKGSAFISAGSILSSKLASGISKGRGVVSKSVADIASGAADGAKDGYASFYDAGIYLGEGLVEGINDMEQAAYDAGFALGQAAVQGEKVGQASASPSKLTIKAGKWLGEGLVIGMGKMTKSVYSSGKDMGQTAVNATRSAMTDVLSILNSDVDSQPTIRPVVDLTDVRSGANNIGKLLNTESSVGVTANLNAVNAMMRNRQNGSTNDDVVSAINKLNKNLGNVGNTSYTVGNITYDDGSNISEAVKSLVRAARVERRV